MKTEITKTYKVDFFKANKSLTEYIPSYIAYVLNVASVNLKYKKRLENLQKSISHYSDILNNPEKLRTYTKSEILQFSDNNNKCLSSLEDLQKEIKSEQIKKAKFEETDFFKELKKLEKAINGGFEFDKAINIIVEWFNNNAFNVDYDLTRTDFPTDVRTMLQHKQTSIDNTITKNKFIDIDGKKTIKMLIMYMYENMIIAGTLTKKVEIPKNLVKDFEKRLEKKKAKAEEKAKKQAEKELEKDKENRAVNAKKKADSKIKGKN